MSHPVGTRYKCILFYHLTLNQESYDIHNDSQPNTKYETVKKTDKHNLIIGVIVINHTIMRKLQTKATISDEPPIKKSEHEDSGTDIGKVQTDSINTQLITTMPMACFISNFLRQWRNWILRGIFSILLISYFWLTIYLGPIVIMVTTLAIQLKCFAEIIDIGYKVYPVGETPFFKLVSWYFLIAANYFCYGETLTDYFSVSIKGNNVLKWLVNYHRFFSFCMYFVGIIWFVLSLRIKYDVHQFSLLACTHVALLLIVTQSYMIVKNILQGLIWLIVPVTLVVCNDIMGFVFGKFFGKTPLIQVSPKKTWEGFIGAAFSTIIYGCLMSYILCHYTYFVCPIEHAETPSGIKMSTECDLSQEFKLKNYTFRVIVPKIMHTETSLEMYPFIFHSLVLSFFGSIIAPFGGFFASGFKRAFNVKDFGATIPGHGGVLDRFDCQFLMATFTNVYITSFIRNYTPETIFTKVLYLEPDQQLQFFTMLKELLKSGNAIK